MPDFLLIYRRSNNLLDIRPSPQQFQNSLAQWQHWYEAISIKNRTITPVKCWTCDGAVVFLRAVDSGHCIEIMESIGGLTFVQAANYQEAVEIAGHCPILQLGGIIEIRLIHIEEDGL